MKKLLLLAFFASAINVNAQWTQTVYNSGPVYCLLPVGSDVFVGTGYGGGIRKLSNDGTTQTAMNTGLVLNGYSEVRSIIQSGSTLFASVGADVFKSTDNGATWVADSVGLPDLIAIWSMTSDGSTIYAGTSNGVYFKTISGASWTAGSTSGFIDKNIYSLAVIGSDLIAGTGYGIYRSSDGGNTWTAKNTGLASPQAVKAFLVDGTKIYAANKNRFAVSTNNGDNWTELFMFGSGNISDIVKTGTNIFIAEDYGWGVGLSQNEAAAVQQNTGLNYNKVNALAISGGYLYDGADGGGVWKRALSEMGIVSVNTMEQKDANILIYPNPSSGKFIVNSQITGGEISVYNITGQKVHQRISLSTAQPIDLSNQPRGIYFVQVKEGEKTYNQKLIVE